MGKGFINKCRVMGQHDNKSIIRNSFQGVLHKGFPFCRKGLIPLGKAVIDAGNIKRSVIMARAVRQLFAPAGTDFYMTVAKNANRRLLQHVADSRQTAVIFMIAIAKINAVRKAGCIVFDDAPARRQQ